MSVTQTYQNNFVDILVFFPPLAELDFHSHMFEAAIFFIATLHYIEYITPGKKVSKNLQDETHRKEKKKRGESAPWSLPPNVPFIYPALARERNTGSR